MLSEGTGIVGQSEEAAACNNQRCRVAAMARLEEISQELIVSLIIYGQLDFGGDWTDTERGMLESR